MSGPPDPVSPRASRLPVTGAGGPALLPGGALPGLGVARLSQQPGAVPQQAQAADRDGADGGAANEGRGARPEPALPEAPANLDSLLRSS